jgi:membrane protein required for colicin V production
VARFGADKPAEFLIRGGSMTWVDLIVLAVVGLSGLLAFSRGFVREVLGLAAWAGAIFAAVWALPLVRPRFEQWLGGDTPWVAPAAFGAVFLVSLIILMIASRWISSMVRDSAIGGLDRTLGLVFGLARGAALVVIAYIIAGMVVQVDRWPDVVLRSQSVWPVYRGAQWVVERIPANHRPQLYAPPGREATADALLRASPQGRAVSH